MRFESCPESPRTAAIVHHVLELFSLCIDQSSLSLCFVQEERRSELSRGTPLTLCFSADSDCIIALVCLCLSLSFDYDVTCDYDNNYDFV